MKPSSRSRSRVGSESSFTTVTFAYRNEYPGPAPQIQSQLTASLPRSTSESPSSAAAAAAAATKIQSAYRSHVVRGLVRKIAAVDLEASRLERLIQRQDTVDAMRSDDRERLRMNEALMALLLRLDSVPGVDPAVRELRRSLSRRIVGLQEIADAICDARVPDWDGFLRCWDEAVAGIEDRVCRERGGGQEMERFCAEKLGFRCLQSQHQHGT